MNTFSNRSVSLDRRAQRFDSAERQPVSVEALEGRQMMSVTPDAATPTSYVLEVGVTMPSTGTTVANPRVIPGPAPRLSPTSFYDLGDLV
jgi:hypothetical protein